MKRNDFIYCFSATNDVDGRGRSRAEEELGNRFAKQLDAVSSEMCNREVQAEWRYATDLTDENAKLKVCTKLFSTSPPIENSLLRLNLARII